MTVATYRAGVSFFAIGLAIIIAIFRKRVSTNVDDLAELRG